MKRWYTTPKTVSQLAILLNQQHKKKGKQTTLNI